jgi:hypothetical protein
VGAAVAAYFCCVLFFVQEDEVEPRSISPMPFCRFAISSGENVMVGVPTVFQALA